MPKAIKDILTNIEIGLEELGLPKELFTLQGTIYTRQPDGMRQGNLRLSLSGVMEALEIANKRFKLIKKLEKRVAKLEAKKCKCKGSCKK